MAGKEYARGFLWALIWLAAGFAALYAVAYFSAQPPRMSLFCLLWLGAWPPVAGFCSGWRAGNGGFAAGIRAMAAPLILVIAAWWWLTPPLWDTWLAAKSALYALAAATLAGGLGAGFKAARQKLCPPPEQDEQDEDEDNKEEK